VVVEKKNPIPQRGLAHRFRLALPGTGKKLAVDIR